MSDAARAEAGQTEGRRTLAGLACLDEAGAPGDPLWLRAARKAAAVWVTEHGFPTRKHEDWRYVDLRPLLDLDLAPAAEGSAAESRARELLPAGLGGARLVLVNGRFAPGLSDLHGLPDGVRVTPMASTLGAGGDTAELLWPARGYRFRHAFEALNAALATDGCVVELDEGASLAEPVEVVHLSVAGDTPQLSSPRVVVVAGAGSSATVVETYAGAGESAAVTNAHTTVLVGPSADLRHYKLQGETPATYHLSTLDVRPGAGSRFSSRLVAAGGLLARHEVRVRLAEEGATADLAGLYLPAGNQSHDNPVLVEHAAPRCTSHQAYRGIVDGSGHGIFNGHVVVDPGAAGTEADQVNKNLLLSDRAEVDTRPRLEIFADDVSCTHGAAVGQLDADALFYLRSRGIPEPDARTLLVSGFAREILERFAAGPIRERAELLVAGHLETAAQVGMVAAGGGR